MDRPDVRQLAAMARLALDESEVERAERELARLLEHFATLADAPTDGVEPSPYPQPIPHRVREDAPAAPLPRDDVLANAPAERADQFLVPRVVES